MEADPPPSVNWIGWPTLTMTESDCEKPPVVAVKLKLRGVGVTAVPVTVKFTVPELLTVAEGGEKLTPPAAGGAVTTTGPANGALKFTLKETGALPPVVRLTAALLVRVKLKGAMRLMNSVVVVGTPPTIPWMVTWSAPGVAFATGVMVIVEDAPPSVSTTGLFEKDVAT